MSLINSPVKSQEFESESVPFWSSTKTFIIAEAGVNHNGSVTLAKQLIDAAAEAGADAVKFQLFNLDTIASVKAPLAAYQESCMQECSTKSQHELLSSLALPLKDYPKLKNYAEKQGIMFLCSPFDEVSAIYLCRELNLPMLKIPSGEITNIPYLKVLGTLNVPIILSTGMSTLEEVKLAYDTISLESTAPLTLLHCVSSYPTSIEAVNLRAIHTLKDTFPQSVIGFSDHTIGIHISLAAVAMGARIIEKHFTLDKSMPGPDHKASLSVDELREMVRAIRDIDIALGDGLKQPHPIELDCIKVARKSIVFSHDLPPGHIITREDLQIKRPGTGVQPKLMEQVIGRRLSKEVRKDELLALEDLN